MEPLPGLIPRHELSQEECLPILAEIRAGSGTAVKLLIEHHLNLVIRLARRHRSDCHSLGDLVQFGLVGLLEAIEQYDPSRKNSFGQVANVRISQHIKRSLMRERRLISLPVRGRLVANKYRYWRERLDLEGVAVTLEGVMREMNVSAFIAEALLQCPHEVLYLDDLSLSGIEPHQQENEAEIDRKIILEELLDRLTPGDRELVCDHFGINGDSHSVRDLVRKYKIPQAEVEERLDWALGELRMWSEAIGYDG